MLSTIMATRNARLVVAVSYVALALLAAAMLVGTPHLPLSGTQLGVVAVLVLALGPVALAIAIARPIILPLALWAALVPFDSVFAHGGLGPVEKLLGIASGTLAFISVMVYRRGFLPPVAAAAWLAFAALAITSFFWAQDPANGILGIQQFVGLVLVGITLSMLPADKLDLTVLGCGIIAGGIASTGYALALYAQTGHELFIGDSYTNRTVDHNHFGAALLLPLICATMGAISGQTTRVRILSAIAAAICLTGLGVSQSRGSMIAFGGAVLYILIRSGNRRRLLPWALSLPVLLAAIPGVIDRFNNADAGNAAGRYEIWHIALAAFKHNWFAGTGFGTFRQAYQAAFLEFAQSSATAQRSQDSHNLIVEMSVELGIIGLGVMLFAWWTQFRTLKIIRGGGGWGELRVTMEAATVALAFMTLSLDLMQYKYSWLIFYSTWIVLAAYKNVAMRAGPAAEALEVGARTSAPRAVALTTT